MAGFGFESTASEVIEGISLAGRTALVTGASAGLGVETARVLAGAGARVVMLARDEGKLAAAVATLAGESFAVPVETVIADLADLDSVRLAARELGERCPRLDLLVNNAGVMACPLARTAQGFEMQFGTNHLGHFLLAGLMAPSLLAAAAGDGPEARVISLSSAGHKFSAMDFDDPNYQRRPYDKWQAYGQSKTANALFAVGLDARLAERGVRSFAVHPGAIMTELSRHMVQEDYDMLMARQPQGKMRFKSTEQGSATSVWAATAPELEGRGGLYLEDCGVAEPARPGENTGVEAHAVDPAAAARLWELSEELVGESLSF